MMLISYLGNILVNGSAVPQAVSAAFPLPVAISGGLAGLAVAGVQPSGVIATANPIIVAGIDGTGTIRDFLVDGSGILQVNATLAGGGVVGQGAGNTANPWTVGGPAATNTANAGNPVKAGAVFNAAPPAIAAGNVGDLQIDSSSNLRTRLVASLVAGADAVSNNNLTAPLASNSASGALNPAATAQFVFNGFSWDRLSKSNSTPFKLPSSAATNNAASIKATQGTVHSITAFNTTATVRYLKLFNTTTAPNPAVLAQVDLIALPAGLTTFVFGPQGEFLSVGIGFAIVANPADLDNTAIAAGDITACVVRYI